MRTHNPLPGVPVYMSLAARFCVLMRTTHPTVAVGDFNVRVDHVEEVDFRQLERRVEAAAHILRVDYEVHSVNKHHVFITLTRRGNE